MRKSILCVFVFSFISTLCVMVSSSSSSWDDPNIFVLNTNDNILKTIVVDQSGHGDFRSVQQAVDSIPSGNNNWIKIYIKNGIYTEKVQITRDKPKIVMEGEDRSTTIIQFNDAGGAIDSATFKLFADEFVGIKISFKNTYDLPLPKNDNQKLMVAPAVVLTGDKVYFHDCVFTSVQDTLADSLGRHFFVDCYIQGAVDFIWGGGQSIYMRCTLNLAAQLGGIPGYITAQGRVSEQDTSGFVFVLCNIIGNTSAYLGRAYRQYSRVIFYRTSMSDIIVPLGWDAWTFVNHEETITYAEVNCTGPGANMQGRVKWEKTLPTQQIDFLTNPKTFLDQDGWMETLPVPISLPIPMY